MKRDRALIVSNDANNRAANTVTVLALAPNVSRVYPFEVLLSPKGKCPCPNLPRLRSSRFALSPRNAYEVTRWADLTPPSCAKRQMPSAFTSNFNQSSTAGLYRRGEHIAIHGNTLGESAAPVSPTAIMRQSCLYRRVSPRSQLTDRWSGVISTLSSIFVDAQTGRANGAI